MKLEELLDIRMNYYDNCKCNSSNKDVTLRDWIGKVSQCYKSRIEEIRQVNKTDEERAKKMKNTLPLVSVTGYFNGVRKDESVCHLNPIIAIDIDRKDNPKCTDWERVKYGLFALPFVFYASLSVRGDGVFLLIEWDNNKDFEKIWHNLYKKFESMGVRIDKSCRNIGRLRYISCDNNALLKEQGSKAFDDDSEAVEAVRNVSKEIVRNVDAELIVNSIYKLVELGYKSDDYNEWLLDGFRLATLGENGRQLFRLISVNSNSFKSIKDVDRKFNECLRTTKLNTNSLAYYYSLLKEYYGSDWREKVLGHEKMHETKTYKIPIINV